MRAELHCLDGTVIHIDRDLSAQLDGIKLGMVGSIRAPGRGKVRTEVIEMTPERILFQELEPEPTDDNPFDPTRTPITAHTFHVGAYEAPDRPPGSPPEVVHVIALCDEMTEDDNEPLRFATLIPLENRAMCDRMIDAIAAARDKAFPVDSSCTCAEPGPVNPCPVHNRRV